MEQTILTSSDKISHEYCASIVRVGELYPIEGSDFLVQTKIAGFNVVVRKDEVKTGDIMFYAANETQLNSYFLSVNNLYTSHELNANAKEYTSLLKKLQENENEGSNTDLNISACDMIRAQLKSMTGFFERTGRVKLIRLRKCPSYGFLFSVDAMSKYCPKIKDINLEELINNESGIFDFDVVDGDLFIKAYMPPVKETHTKSTSKKERKLARYDRIIPGEFQFHYDTMQLNKMMYAINPKDVVSITLKLHGTSICIGNILTNSRWHSETGISVIDKPLNFLYRTCIPDVFKSTKRVYDVIYSSRTVIKNKYENYNKVGFYDTDVWSEWYKRLKMCIPEGIMLYGEIIGYQTNGKEIQKGYDYGCDANTNKLMIYRVVNHLSDGTIKEYNVSAVYDFTIELIKKHPELKDFIHPIDILYHGTLMNLYPNIDVKNKWHDNVLEALKNEKDLFGMEGNEPLCKNKIPREGIVIRIDNDPKAEAFKLKCTKFLEAEGVKVSNNSMNDIEAEQKY